MTDATMATIVIERRGVGLFELRGNFFDVTIDGKSVATLARYGDSATFEVPPGPHLMQIRQDRYRSRALEFDAFAGGTLRFRTHGPMLPPRYLISAAFPSFGIDLHRS